MAVFPSIEGQVFILRFIFLPFHFSKYMNNETLEQLLTENEIRERMSVISRRYPTERRTLRDAYQGLAKAKAEAHLATMFLDADLLHDPRAKEFLAKAKARAVKMIADDKSALVALETEERQTAYDLAKFDCETSEKDYAQLEKQLSFFQTVMRFTGAPVPLEETVSWG